MIISLNKVQWDKLEIYGEKILVVPKDNYYEKRLAHLVGLREPIRGATIIWNGCSMRANIESISLVGNYYEIKLA